MHFKAFLGAIAASILGTTQTVQACESEALLLNWWEDDAVQDHHVMMFAQIDSQAKAEYWSDPDKKAIARMAGDKRVFEKIGGGGGGGVAGAEDVYDNPLDSVPTPIASLGEQMRNDTALLLVNKTAEMKKALLEIPYLKQVLMGGELAKMAFDYMKANAPLEAKNAANTVWQEKVAGRFAAFKGWLKEAWSGKTGLHDLVGSYLDYLALFNPGGDSETPVSLRIYFDATRCANDRGHYGHYQRIINRLGLTADKQLYKDLRMQARNEAYDKRLDQTSAKIDKMGTAFKQKITVSPLPKQVTDEQMTLILPYFDNEFDTSVSDLANLQEDAEGKLVDPNAPKEKSWYQFWSQTHAHK